MQSRRNSNRFPSVFLIVGVAMAAVVPAVRVFSTEKRHAPQRVALIAPGSGSNVAVQFVIEPDNTPEPRTLIAPDASRPDPQVPPVPTAQPGEVDVVHVGRIISATPVARKGGSPSSRAASHLQLGDACDCDEDCDPSLGDQCNMVQCIVRSTCTGDHQTPCTTDGDCQGNGTCNRASGSFIQRCDTVQLIGWPCDADGDFCTLDRCGDDGSGTGHSVCMAQNDRSGSPLSPCAKQCVGGPANGLRCTKASDCPQGSCQITAGGGCDSAAEACYVGGSLATAIGRCCTAGVCTETDEASCAGGWYRYRDPEEQAGDGNCLCPKYGSGVAPPGSDLGSIGLVRPSGLVCQVSVSEQCDSLGKCYCEDPDGDGLAPQFCHKRCVGGDNEGAICEVDNPDCALSGICSVSGDPCLVSQGGSDCPAPGGQSCISDNPGTCVDDTCASNTIEGGCEDGFLSIGDDYDISNGSFQRLTQFRFRGGVTNPGEDIVIEFWDSTGTKLVDAFAINDIPFTGTHDWTIEVDCWPNCNPNQQEVPLQRPIIIPPDGWVVMRSTRTIGTIDGAAAFWSQTDSPDVGGNDNTRMWVNGDPNASLGTNVMIFELVGTKVPTPLGACCENASACTDTLRWECGFCSGSNGGQLCASTLHDCPIGGSGGSLCRFNRWFGPISHDEIEFGGVNLTLCNGLSPCNTGACCDGFSCTVTTEADCNCAGCDYRGIATDCTPNCCPVANPSGSDCVCATSTCVETALSCLGGADEGSACTTNADCAVTNPLDPGECGNLNLGLLCDTDADCEGGIATCVLQCEPNGVTQLRHPYECIDDFGSPLEPPISCDPALDVAFECPPIPCTNDGDCPALISCFEGFCEDTSAMTCEQSFTTSFSVVRNDTIAGDLFTVLEGEACSLNTFADRVGWYELINLPDPTPGDGADDCYILTVGLCCTDPLSTPVWPFLSSFLTCPCIGSADVSGIAPDFDFSGDQLDGFGANSKASPAGRCEDGNYSATFTVPPGQYAYQINADTSCAGSATPCDTDNDCPGSSCVAPNPDYTVHFTVESCNIGACCVNESCIITNKMDCEAQDGNFLGDGDQPIVFCVAGACALGSCCVDGTCLDDAFHDTQAECLGVDGEYFGLTSCFDSPCPACPFDTPANCQQVQTIFGAVPLMDRNPENGSSDGSVGTVLADDVKFGGSTVDQICWNTAFFATPCCDEACMQNIDDSWEIRIYGPNPDCVALPGPEVGMSTITVLNKLEGTGQGTATWHYSGSVDTPITLPNGGIVGDTYWFEVSGFGEPGCAVRAMWSRDDGNKHHVAAQIASDNDPRAYDIAGIGNVDVGFCENSGLATPPDVLGSCCTSPATCQENFTKRDCGVIRGVWFACTTCADMPCPAGGAPANDDFTSATIISGVPDPDDRAELLVPGDNIFATDDGPPLSGLPDAGSCGPSLVFYGDMHHDVWYSYVAEGCGLLTVSACEDADFDLMIAAYPPPAGLAPTKEEQISCADDNCGREGGPASMTIPVSLGDELLIRVGGWNDLVAGGNHGHPRGSFVLHWTLDRTCPPIEPPILAPPPHDILKNRYISIDPRGAGGTNVGFPFDIKLTLTVTLVNGVTAVGSTYWAQAPDADCNSLVTADEPIVPPLWDACPTLHLTGCPIIPTSTYGIVVVAAGTESSPPLAAATQAKPGNRWWGDVVGLFDGNVWTPPNGVVNPDDIVAVTKTFQDPNGFSAVHLSVADLHPVSPAHIDKLVTLGDVCAVTSGFQGQEYPGPALELCPPIHSSPCQCNGDVNDNGITTIEDVFAIINCVENGNCSGCGHFCDVNCDGLIDLTDADNAICSFQGNPPDVCCIPAPRAGDLGAFCCTDDDGLCLDFQRYKRKNRYISIKPNNSGLPVKLKVTLHDSLAHPNSAGESWWVKAPVAPQRPLLPAGECLALLGPESDAAEIDWQGQAANCQTLHITGCPIMPTSNYLVQAVSGPGVSSVLTVPTILRPGNVNWWGDVVGIFDEFANEWTPPQGVTNINDVNAAILTWQGGPFVAPDGNIAHLSVPDVEPGNINTFVNFADVQWLIKAFQGAEYPFGPPNAEGICP